MNSLNFIFNLIKTENCEQSNPLGQLNNTLTDDDLRNFEEWNKYDASQDNFCEPDGKIKPSLLSRRLCIYEYCFILPLIFTIDKGKLYNRTVFMSLI